MGRGRAKAKQTKVARDLKYDSQEIDLKKLADELHGEMDNSNNGMMTIHLPKEITFHVLNFSRVS